MGNIGGKERTLVEWERVFLANGWALEEVVKDTHGGPLCSLFTVAKA